MCLPVSFPWAGLRCHQASNRNREGYLGIQTGTLDSRHGTICNPSKYVFSRMVKSLPHPPPPPFPLSPPCPLPTEVNHKAVYKPKSKRDLDWWGTRKSTWPMAISGCPFLLLHYSRCRTRTWVTGPLSGCSNTLTWPCTVYRMLFP